MAEEARDLLRKLSGEFSGDKVGGGDSDEIELELSIGGCFSSKISESSRVFRSTSIPTVLPRELPPLVPLVKACSLPSETEEIRRRREMQSIKRMETKRKREEKRNSKRCYEVFEGGSIGKMSRLEFQQNGVLSSLRSLRSASQGSGVSQGSTSSGGSEFEGHLGQGFELLGCRTGSDMAMAELNSFKASSISSSSSSTQTQTSKSIGGADIGNMTGEVGTSMEEMPSVSTTGDLPNGRRIEGFLYRYRGAEDVSIVCVCHGSFLTPAEFVRHAGGGDVPHPLRHIVVNPSSGILS